MGNYVSSYLKTETDEELSLEKACKLLETVDCEDKIEEQIKYDIPDNLVSTKVGKITDIINDNCVIDGKYIFPLNAGLDLTVGSKVSYNLFNSNDTFKVVNLSAINNDWDSIEDSDSVWNDRIIICQVEKRVQRKLFLSDTDIAINLDDVSLEFLPMVGDWLELDVKCVVNENNLDLSGKIIEINKVSPVRLHIETGKITSWKRNEEVGTINNKIFFNKAALPMGYVPVLGDGIVSEVIESDQNRCSWRAIKLLPESLSKRYEKVTKCPINVSDYKDSYPGLEISDVILAFEKLGETKKFSIDIKNGTGEILVLKTAEFLNDNYQCKIVTGNENMELLPDDSVRIPCECLSKNVGHNKEFFTLTFQEFTIGKWADISVTINTTNEKIPYEYKPKLQPHEESTNELIRGQKSAGSRFSTAPIPNYSIPQRLIDAVSKSDSKNIEILIDRLKAIKPSLTSNLTLINYEDKFHTLLHLDEIANLVAIRTYDRDRACFIRNAEFLMLEIENLSERRPSIIVGDRIIATDPMRLKSLDYEGFVHKVAAKHVYIKFNRLFHDGYNGEDYSIKVVPGRAAYKRQHHAVHLAARNLSQQLLFPAKIVEREPQIDFAWDSDIPTTPLRNRTAEVMDKIQKSINNKAIKLEWYNKQLNPKQKNAVRHVLWGKARPLPYIIFGPPGTGKTVTVIETVLQTIRLLPSSRLLVTAPSNSAADLMALRLIDSGVLVPGDLVRIVSYNYAVSDMIPAKLVPYCATASRAKEDTGFVDPPSNGGVKFECCQSTLGRHRITVATCSASGQFFNLPKGHFTHIIVDEAAQAGEPDVMTAMALLDRSSGQVVLAGDPMQLGPVVLCKVASECGLNESYLERLINRFPYVRDPEGFPDTSGFDPRLVTKLLYNYRALPDILRLYNQLFYNDELIATIDQESSPEAHLLDRLREILPKKSAGGDSAQIVFHGVDGVNYRSADSPSWYNPQEAAQVFRYVNEFYRLGVKSGGVGIITPYVKQVKEIRSLLSEAEFELPRTGTIEEFQGQEFDVIVLSTVRSCDEYLSSDAAHSLGFVASPKRLNVAVSRSKSLLIVVGNPKLLCRDTYWRYVVKYCVDMGCYVGCEF